MTYPKILAEYKLPFNRAALSERQFLDVKSILSSCATAEFDGEDGNVRDLWIATVIVAIRDYGRMTIDCEYKPNKKRCLVQEKKDIENFLRKTAPLLGLNGNYLIWRMRKYEQLTYQRWMNNRDT